MMNPGIPSRVLSAVLKPPSWWSCLIFSAVVICERIAVILSSSVCAFMSEGIPPQRARTIIKEVKDLIGFIIGSGRLQGLLYIRGLAHSSRIGTTPENHEGLASLSPAGGEPP